MSPVPSYDESKVLRLLAEGNELAFTQLFNHYRGKIYGSALKFLKNREAAEEIVQEVFLKVWRNREHIAAVNSFADYLFVMSRNLTLDSLAAIIKNSAAVKELSHDSCFDNSTESAIHEMEYEVLLQEAVDSLPPQQKRIFYLAKVKGLSHEAIAEQMELSRLTVKTHMVRALKSIRHRLQPHLGAVSVVAAILMVG